jgi:DNA-binding PadR family transcriptional regulator
MDGCRLPYLIHDAIYLPGAMPREALGDIEHFVLVALVRLGGESYGVPILEEISERTGREVARSAVYVALRRLENKGFVRSRMGEATAVRGGRPKRFFSLTRAGARQLVSTRRAFERMWADVERLAEKAAR